MIKLLKRLTKIKNGNSAGSLGNTPRADDRINESFLLKQNNLAIRKYQSGDKNKVLQIAESSFDGVSLDENIENIYGTIGKPWREHKQDAVLNDLRKNPRLTLIAELNGVIVGFVCCRYYPSRSLGHIANLAVEQKHQGGEIGKKLLSTSIKLLQKHGAKYVRIETLEQNERAINFYSNDGFQEVGRQVFYFKKIS